jgi:hypothetical protein
MRPVWQNEVIGDICGDFDPQYDISVDGTVLHENAKLTLKNPIATYGTRHSADNMNNLFDMDNMDSMRGHYRTTVFNADGSITEEIKNSITNVRNALRVTTFPAGGFLETTTIFTDDGQFIVRETAIATSFPDSKTIREDVR